MRYRDFAWNGALINCLKCGDDLCRLTTSEGTLEGQGRRLQLQTPTRHCVRDGRPTRAQVAIAYAHALERLPVAGHKHGPECRVGAVEQRTARTFDDGAAAGGAV